MKRAAKPANTILFLALLFTTFRLNSQELTTAELVAHIKDFFQATPWEDVYLHIDRDKYISGEDIWFSIYCTDRETGKLSFRSDVAYVELLNPWNIPVIQTRFKLSGGRGEGKFLLPDSISPGTYTIRAYTNWMKNFLPGNCYMQNIDIYNPFRSSDFLRKVDLSDNKSNSAALSFFPESGKLLNGIINKVVARCINNKGEGVVFAGIIRDNNGDSVTSFRVGESGYGSFFIRPENGKNYSVSVTGGSFPLPEAINDGFLVTVDYNLNESVDIILNAAGSYALPSSKNYFLIIQPYGKTVFTDNFKIKDSVTKITVSGDRLTGGVCQIALIGEDGRVLFKRMIYYPPKKENTINVTAKSIYGRREKVSLRLGINNNDAAKHGIYDGSISVTSADVSAVGRGIDDYMIFGSEFGKDGWTKGDTSIARINQDVVNDFLICSESSWINWQDIITGKRVPKQYMFESDRHYLSVILKYRENNISDSSKFLYMSIQGKVAEFIYAQRDSAGRFNFLLPVDYKLRNLIIQPEHPNNNMMLEIEPSFSWILPSVYCFKDTLSDAELDLFSGFSFNYQAEKIYGIMLKKEAETDGSIKLQKGRFYGIPEMEVFLDKYISLPSMQEVFFELLPGIIIRSRKSGYDMRITNPLTGVFYDEPPLVMIDGVIINDLTVLVDLKPEMVEKVEVVKTPYVIGDLILHGIVNVITRSGNFSNITMPDYAVILPYRVVDKPFIFTSPDYSEEKSRLSRAPDLRNTLYWNPSVKTDMNGEAEIEFWTSDIPGIYTVSIQCISETGEKVSAHKSFIVR